MLLTSSAATPHTLSTASRYEAETPLGKTGRSLQFVIKLLKSLMSLLRAGFSL